MWVYLYAQAGRLVDVVMIAEAIPRIGRVWRDWTSVERLGMPLGGCPRVVSAMVQGTGFRQGCGNREAGLARARQASQAVVAVTLP